MNNKKYFFKLIVLLVMALIFVEPINAAPNLNLIYVIQQGDTLSEIASDYNVNRSKLKKMVL